MECFYPDRVVARFPGLSALAVAGRLCRTSTLLPLGKLADLQFLSLAEIFPEQPEFPSPSCWPQLTLLRLHSAPDALARAVKKSFKSLAPDELDLDVRRPRKPDWLADNMDNLSATGRPIEASVPGKPEGGYGSIGMRAEARWIALLNWPGGPQR